MNGNNRRTGSAARLATVATVLGLVVAARGQDISITNVIPNNFSHEVSEQSEPSIAVNGALGASHEMMICTFGVLPTPMGAAGPRSSIGQPCFTSAVFGNPGATWSNLDIHNYVTGDTTIEWSSSGTAYGTFLIGGGSIDARSSMAPHLGQGLSLLPGSTYIPPGGYVPDQPWMEVARVGGQDRIYIGFNDLSRLKGALGGTGTGQTASLRYSLDGGITWSQQVLENGAVGGFQDEPEVRVSIVGDRVYTSFIRINADNTRSLVVRRDDNKGTNNFADLTKVVPQATSYTAPAVGSLKFGSMSIVAEAAFPNNVLVAVPQVAGGVSDLNLYQSVDSGATWLGTIFDSTNVPAGRRFIAADHPALAYATNGCLAMLYTKVTDKAGAPAGTQMAIEARLARSCDDFQFSYTDVPLARFKADLGFEPFIGDYQDLEVVGDTFFGTFSSMNDPSRPQDFPQGVKFQRQLVNAGVGMVCPAGGMPHVNCRLGDGSGAPLVFPDGTTQRLTIDPYFFRANVTPEPGTAGLVCLGAGLLLRRRRGWM